MRLRQRTADWVTHTFREHNKEADLWAGKGRAGGVQKNGWTPPALRGEGGHRYLRMVPLLQKVWPCTRELLHGC